jgi:hypothetical protein
VSEFKTKAIIPATIIRETEKAILCDVGKDKPAWIPKSMIDDDSEIREVGESGEITISEWFARKEGLI